MNQIELSTFLAIIESGSLVRASRALNVTQSTVTARLKALEDELGQTLIVRQKSGATLTPAGMRLERYANTICDLWQQAQIESALPAGFDAVCNLACESDLWPGVGERLFNFLCDHHPQLAISVWHGSAEDIQRWLSMGRCDLAITHQVFPDTRLQHHELTPDTLVLVSTEQNSPARFDPGYVFLEHGETFGREHAAAYADADTARLSFNDVQCGLAHVRQYGGSAYVPQRWVTQDIENGLLYKVSDAPTFERRVLLSVSGHAQQSWPWFDAVLADLRQKSGIR